MTDNYKMEIFTTVNGKLNPKYCKNYANETNAVKAVLKALAGYELQFKLIIVQKDDRHYPVVTWDLKSQCNILLSVHHGFHTI